MSDPGPALKVLLDALHEGLSRPEVRTALADLGRWLVAAAESAAPPDLGHTPSAAPEPADPPPPTFVALHTPPADAPASRPIPIVGPAVPSELKIGDSNRLEVVTRGQGIVSTRELAPEPPAPPPPTRRSEEPELPDLRRVAHSAHLKAAACAQSAAGEATGTLRDQILAAREGEAAFDGGLWMCSRLDNDGRTLAASAALCYRALAAAAELGAFLQERDQLHSGRALEEPFQLMAQAQSMVRNFVEDGRGDDLDQLDMFHWLRTLTSEYRCRVLVSRYMRRGDMAPPAEAPTVLAKLAGAHQAWKTSLDGAKERRRLLGKVRHKTGLLASAVGPDAAVVWSDMERVFTDLAREGVRPSDPELVLALSGAPEPGPGTALSDGLADALRRARAAADPHDEPAESAEPDAAPPSPDVAEAARLLRGRVMLLVGGEVKPLRRQAIERAFGLRELRWIPANMNDSSTGNFEPQLRRAETALVVRMVRFTRTNHGELLDLCKRHGRAFVNLPAGYGVNQLATEIISQAGTHLRSLPTAG